MITKSMKKETRLEIIECALSVIRKDMTENIVKSLLKRKLQRVKLLESIKAELKTKKVDLFAIETQWKTEMKKYSITSKRKNEPTQGINERMLLMAHVRII